MEAQELRIGNWCNIVKSPFENEIGEFQIEAITIHYFECGDDLILEPIPLTEEWLLKFGFVKEKGYYVMGVHQSRFSGLMKFKFDPLLQLVFSVGSYKDITRVKYVHDLMNLYFALTGEELTIKS